LASRSKRRSPRSERVKTGIIGGTGKMGRLFAGVFRRAGYEVMVSGRTTKVTGHDIAKECDIIIVSVPIRDTVRVIGEIAPLLKKSQLICDLTSLKIDPVAAMLGSKAEVIGLHPMFGPTVKSFRKQTIIACPVRAKPASTKALLAVFRAEGAVCTITTPEEHDRMMAVVQGLTHYVTLCMADSIRRLGIDIDTTKAFMSPVYAIELSLVGRLLSQDPDLYGSILQENPFVPDVLMACRDAGSELSEIIASGDPEKFNSFFSRNTRHFGDYCAEGMAATDTMIEGLVNR
jgi:prephenate dehydrogenase